MIVTKILGAYGDVLMNLKLKVMSPWLETIVELQDDLAEHFLEQLVYKPLASLLGDADRCDVAHLTLDHPPNETTTHECLNLNSNPASFEHIPFSHLLTSVLPWHLSLLMKNLNHLPLH